MENLKILEKLNTTMMTAPRFAGNRERRRIGLCGTAVGRGMHSQATKRQGQYRLKCCVVNQNELNCENSTSPQSEGWREYYIYEVTMRQRNEI